MNTSQHSDIFSYDDESQDMHLTLTASQNDLSSTYTPFVENQRDKLIWGTTINVEYISEKIRDIIRGDSSSMEQLENMNMIHEFVFSLDCSKLNVEVRDLLCRYPLEMIPIFENCLKEVYQECFVTGPDFIRFRPYGIGRDLTIRSVDPGDIETIVIVRGMVTRVGKITPEIHRGYYQCARCGGHVEVEALKGVLTEPTRCECGRRMCFTLRQEKSVYSDRQIIRVQELPESMEDGATPMAISVVLGDELIDTVIPGDKVDITAVLRADPVRLSPWMKKVRSCFRVHCEGVYISVAERVKHEEDMFVEVIDSLRQKNNVYEILSGSIAPSIYGHTNVKKGLLLQLVSGVAKNLEKSRLRGDINILLAGDPGIAKSQLLTFVHAVCGRGIYTSGRGSSAVGLSVSVAKDAETGQFVLESGALVLSDRGICCIDEFDKMADTTKAVLHEVMEQQTVSLAKAGIITTLNARCSILASCNPLESKYNSKKTILENINVMPTLLSRFDLVFLLIDKHDVSNDREVADHILRQYANVDTNKQTQEIEIVDICVLKAYIKEARKISPVITEDAAKALSDAYVDLRQLDNGKSLTATTRQLESLIRLSEAHAKIRFSSSVDVHDVQEAARLIKESLLLYAVDPHTGRIDINMIVSGKTYIHNKLIEDLRIIILKNIKKSISLDALLNKTGAEEKLLVEALDELEREEVLFFDRHTNLIERISGSEKY